MMKHTTKLIVVAVFFLAGAWAGLAMSKYDAGAVMLLLGVIALGIIICNLCYWMGREQ